MLEQMHEQTLLWWLCWGVTRVVRRERVGERGAHTLQAETGACTRAGSRYIATSGRPFALPVPDSRLQTGPAVIPPGRATSNRKTLHAKHSWQQLPAAGRCVDNGLRKHQY